MNVHILSDTPRATSAYANITRNLAAGLAGRGHNVTITGFLNGYENFHGIDVLPLGTPFTHPRTQFANNLRSSKADVLICIHEAHADTNIYSQMFAPSFFWVPVEGEGIPEHMSRDLKSHTLAGVIPMSKVGKTQLEAEGVECRDAVYPGYDPEIFTTNPKQHCKWSMDLYQHMQDPKLLCQRGCYHCSGSPERDCKYFEQERVTINYGGKIFSGNPQAFDRLRDNIGVEYVIGCVAQNVGTRKRIERLIEAFSKMEYKKDAILHLHTLPESGRGIDLFKEARKHGVLDKIMFSYGDTAVYGISDHAMNLLYNYFTMNATASGYEGFGMPVLESASVGKPQVAPASGTFPELLGENERGLLASVATSSMDADGLTRSLVDTESLADKIDALCMDAGLRHELGDAGANWAKQYTWDKTVRNLEVLLLEYKEKAACKNCQDLI